MELYNVADHLPGTLFIMPKPKLSQLPDIRAAGVDHVVSLLSEPEGVCFGLEKEAQACHAAGMTFRQFQIEDFGIPEETAFDILVDRMIAQLQAGETVAVHCRAGVGRSGMTACCVLNRLGWGVDAAIAKVSQARGMAVPETPPQFRFVVIHSQRHAPVAQAPGSQ